MRLTVAIACLSFILNFSTITLAQDSNTEESAKSGDESAPEDFANILNQWQKNQGKTKTYLPRRWLFLQQAGGVYGAPTPLNVDKISFENLGWFQAADADAIRLYIQMNPGERKDEIKPEELPARLKRYAELAAAEGIILKTSDENGSWAVYRHTKSMNAPIVSFLKGPDSFRGDVPAQWLVSQLNYDAMVVGMEGDYLILAKLKPLKKGSQGLILKKSSTAIVADAEKEVGALLRVLVDSEDFALAKVSLSKAGKLKVPVGSKVLFDSP